MHRGFPLVLLLAALFLLSASAGLAQDTYTVEPRDVLDLIAARYDVDTMCLAEANELENPSELRVGQTLVIDMDCPRYTGLAFVTNPRDSGEQTGQGGGEVDILGQGGGDSSGPQPGPDDQTYTVERGDTLDTIAQEFNVSLVSLQIVNDLRDPNAVVMAGDTIIIPAGAPEYGQYPALVDPAAPVQSQELGQGGGANVGPGDQVYVVQPRDVLDLIGAAYDADVTCIAEANSLDDPHTIFAGQSIVVPASCPRYQGEAFVPNPRGE